MTDTDDSKTPRRLLRTPKLIRTKVSARTSAVRSRLKSPKAVIFPKGIPGRQQKPKEAKQTFSELFFPGRPSQLWARARKLASQPIPLPEGRRLGLPLASNAAYIRWLRNGSMLRTADRQASKYAGKATMWQNPYARPRPRAAIKMSSVWYTAYPASLITKGRESILHTLGNDDLWQAFQEIGITGLHTGPMKYGGGIDGWKFTPSVDGHFDRISNRLDRLFGTEAEFRRLSDTASRHNGIIIDDLIPGHTGKGSDFRLAEMAYGTYPGIYHMIEIPKEDWHLLPAVPKGQDAANLSPDAEEELKKRGYIIGKLSRVIFYEPGVKETNWSATPVVRGVDGIRRRWVYLHFFKQGQPTINWLDPSFGGMKLVIGDALHSIDQLGSRGLRLDANGFLGIEKTDEDKPAWSEGHPLSEAANHLIAGSVRKVGGFTFQEFNVALDDMQAMASGGADLSYDFVSRPGYHHAVATGSVEFLRMMLLEAKRFGIDPVSMVHALQNHDELTYELVHFWTVHKDDIYTYQGKDMPGSELRTVIQTELREAITGPNAPYNQPHTENGIACTTASVITAALGIKDFLDITEEDTRLVQDAHLLMAQFNALQPGVFAMSGWDLRGVLTLDPDQISNLLKDGDTRWLERGSYDIMDVNPQAEASLSGMPKAPCLYASLPDQLDDEDSFASRLKHMLSIRESLGLALAKQIDLPEADDQAVLCMVHRLPSENGGQLQATVLNFANRDVSTTITSPHFTAGDSVSDALGGESLTGPDKDGVLRLELRPYQALCLVFNQ